MKGDMSTIVSCSHIFIHGYNIWTQFNFSFSALTLASSEVRFNIDSETHDPIDLQVKKIL